MAAAEAWTPAPCQPGFFVDWNGDTRRTEAPGAGMSCIVRECALNGEPYLGVDVVDHEGFVTYEATYFPDLETLQKEGISIRMAA
jgi:hypothetical protein